MMGPLPIRVQVLNRAPESVPPGEGGHLQGLVEHALEAGGTPGPVAVVVRETRTELLDLGGAAQAGVHLHRFLGGLTRSRPEGLALPVAVGLAGRFMYRSADARGRPSPPVPVALAFLEWPDCSWWHWQVLLDGDGHPVPDSGTVRSAAAGDPLPAGLGRWWSLGRRSGVAVRYEPAQPPPVPAPTSPWVH